MMVLHDVNEAARVSHRIVAMRDGQIVREGPPARSSTPSLLAELYGVPCDVYPHRDHGQPFCVPRSAAPTRTATASRPRRAASASGRVSHRLRRGGRRRAISRLTVPAGAITAIVGPNACGKSTLLRTCGRLLQPQRGGVGWVARTCARGATGRWRATGAAAAGADPLPPGSWSRIWSRPVACRTRASSASGARRTRRRSNGARRAATSASCATGRWRPSPAVSSGAAGSAWRWRRTRRSLLLDEPTTFLDLAAQIELLDLVRALNREQGRTVVMVLHDLNLAARYADYLVVMKDGADRGDWRPARGHDPRHAA